MVKEHKDPDVIDLDAPRLAWCKQKTWKKHQNTVYWVDIQLAQKERIQVLSNTIERNHPSRHAPNWLYPEDSLDGNWRNHIREKYFRHLDLLRRFHWKIIGWKNWVQKLLEVVKSLNKSNQRPKNPIVRTGRPVLVEQPSGSSAQEIEKRLLLGCESTNERTRRLVSIKAMDCHMQLWNKQKASFFANSGRRSRVILIEKHFRQTCSKITSTTHSVTNRKRWFVKWAM